MFQKTDWPNGFPVTDEEWQRALKMDPYFQKWLDKIQKRLDKLDDDAGRRADEEIKSGKDPF